MGSTVVANATMNILCIYIYIYILARMQSWQTKGLGWDSPTKNVTILLVTGILGGG